MTPNPTQPSEEVRKMATTAVNEGCFCNAHTGDCRECRIKTVAAYIATAELRGLEVALDVGDEVSDDDHSIFAIAIRHKNAAISAEITKRKK